MPMTRDGAVTAPAGAGMPEPLVPDVLGKPPGFERLHPDVSINVQLNRWLGWMTGGARGDVAAAAARADGYAELTGEFLAPGDRLDAEDRHEDSSRPRPAPHP